MVSLTRLAAAWLAVVAAGDLAADGEKPASASGKLPSGVVLYYPFDTPETALSSFGSAKDALRQGSGNVAFSVSGRFGGCLYFHGDDTLELPKLPAAMPLGKSPYTVAAWIRADKGLVRTGGWIGYGARNIAGAGNSFRHNGPDGVQNYWNFRDLNVETPGLADGRWHHVVGTWDGTTRRLYVDGRLAGSDRQVPDVQPGPLVVGATINDRPYNGWIDEVLVAARAFTEGEISALVKEGVARVVAPSAAADDGKLLDANRFVTRAELQAGLGRTLEVTGRWLKLPVKDDGRPRPLKAYSGETLYRVFEIALADGEPDWYAVLDVSELKGKKITLALEGGRAATAGLKRVSFSDDAPVPDGYDGKYRPQFHFSPARGWMNDPNGLSFYNGEWHLFFQHNPYGTKWGNMHWGHAVSKDLFHWREVGEALYPDELGAMFSGSAVVDKDNTAGFGRNAHVLVFTGTANGSTQSIAYSLDGRNYTKYEGNPVVQCITGGNRDPRVFWYKPGRHWVMVLYVVENGHKNTVVLNSPDLKKWTRVGTIVGDREPGGGFLHECPELFELPVEGEKTTRWVVFGATGEYAVGTFDGRNFKQEGARASLTRRFGGYYAAQTFGDVPDGRRILLPWFQVKMPGMPFNQEFALPRELKLVRSGDSFRVLQFPVKEVESLRDGPAKPFAEFEGELVEAFVEFRPAGINPIVLSLRGIRMRYDPARELLEVPGGTVSWPLEKGWFRARVFIDRTGMETFSLDGATCLPSQDAVADPANRRLEIVEGAENVLDDRSFAYELESVWR